MIESTDLVNAVWQSLRDVELKALTFRGFQTLHKDTDTDEETLEEAWYEYQERVARVFMCEADPDCTNADCKMLHQWEIDQVAYEQGYADHADWEANQYSMGEWESANLELHPDRFGEGVYMQ